MHLADERSVSISSCRSIPRSGWVTYCGVVGAGDARLVQRSPGSPVSTAARSRAVISTRTVGGSPCRQRQKPGHRRSAIPRQNGSWCAGGSARMRRPAHEGVSAPAPVRKRPCIAKEESGPGKARSPSRWPAYRPHVTQRAFLRRFAPPSLHPGRDTHPHAGTADRYTVLRDRVDHDACRSRRHCRGAPADLPRRDRRGECERRCHCVSRFRFALAFAPVTMYY